MLQIIAKTNSARLVQFETERPILGMLTEIGVQVQVRRQTGADGLHWYTVREQWNRQEEHQLLYPHAWKLLQEDLK